jgi:hypothetical protein
MKPTLLTALNASRHDSFDPAMRSRRESLKGKVEFSA